MLCGMTDVPTVRLTDMTEAQLRAYVIAENAGWDRELLALDKPSPDSALRLMDAHRF